MKTIKLNISEQAFKYLQNTAVIKKLLPDSRSASDTFLLLIIEAIQEGKEEKTIQLRK